MIKLGLVIASHGRPDLLQQIVTSLSSQRRIPDAIVISAVAPADITASTQALSSVRTIFGSAGLTCQRNRGISCLIDTVDVIAFIDDDFIVGHDYFHNMERLFEHDELIIGINAEIVADGADLPGFTFEEGLRLAEQYRRQKTEPVAREITGKYADGCNGIIAFRSTRAGALRFDERLPLYGWQEDLDFCVALRRLGRIVRTNLIWGVHLGTKRGKGSEVRTRLLANRQSGLYCQQGEHVSLVCVTAGCAKRCCQHRQEHPARELCRSSRPPAGQRDRHVSLDCWPIDSRIHSQTEINSPLARINGIAEAFVNTFKRDYARLSILPDAKTVIALLPAWFEDYNEVHPHSA